MHSINKYITRYLLLIGFSIGLFACDNSANLRLEDQAPEVAILGKWYQIGYEGSDSIILVERHLSVEFISSSNYIEYPSGLVKNYSIDADSIYFPSTALKYRFSNNYLKLLIDGAWAVLEH
jgi:hypothetical protein